MQDLLAPLLYAFTTLFVILDPLLSVPIFVSLTAGSLPEEKARQAGIAVAVAGALMYLFLVFGLFIFDILGITLASFEVAGGILLFILGIQESLGIEFGHEGKERRSMAGVVIGTPLLCGPGAITTVVLLSTRVGAVVTGIAIGLCLGATWLVLRYAAQIQRFLGETVTDIMGKVLGMLLAAIAVKIIVDGIVGLI
ncbi:MAG: MarC family protein [Methanofollis liminatans]|jgi:multiple antibiotic resistance protein|uniref:UPF0056 membrane protein n=1 Tax=Methanofollis liminatans DSM 4140 TaxID=28892 RepID=J0S6F3_9EURY|nr:MarC family protein [Methanofollis liminatans]EJG06104.1 multiple antibiotic resistance (MarC)-related protein [Methanofollis liminatans DSM 4140]MDD3110726.1 MarC family protein [Methanofollis liminatans]